MSASPEPLALDNSSDFVMLQEFLIYVEDPIKPFEPVISNALMWIRYEGSPTLHPVLTAPSIKLDDFVQITCSRAYGEVNPRARAFLWFDLKRYSTEIVDRGIATHHRAQLCAMLHNRGYGGRSKVAQHAVMSSNFRKLCERVLFATDANIPENMFNTALWAAQRYFLSRALALDSEGTQLEWFPSKLTRLANEAGNEVFFDTFLTRVVHASEVELSNCSLVGGYLIDSIGIGKTFSMLALCALNRPPPGYGTLSENGELARHTDGRLISRATIIVCPAQVATHWCDQIAKHLTGEYRVISLTTKRDLDKYLMKDLLSADFIVTTFNFLINPAIKDVFVDYGGGGWRNLNVRVAGALHDTKRQRVSDYISTNQKITLPIVHFWRLIVDELHELKTVANRSTMESLRSLNARSRWGVSASLFADADAFSDLLDFQLPASAVFGCRSNIIDSIGCINTFATMFIKSDPTTHTEIQLPGIREDIHWLTMSETEMRIYRSFHNNESAQLRCCCMPRLATSEVPEIEDCTTVEDAVKRVQEHMQAKLTKYQQSVAHWSSTVERTRAMLAVTTDSRVLRSTLVQAERELDIYTKSVDDAERSLRFVSNSIAEDSTECTICMDTIEIPALLPCGHMFCESCINRLVTSTDRMNRRCPMCRTQIHAGTSIIRVHVPDPSAAVVAIDPLVSTHGTKMASIIKFIKESIAQDPTEKFVIYSRYDSFIHEVGSLLSTHITVLYCRGSHASKNKSIQRFNTDASCPVLMLSTEHSGSGVCLTVARNLVVLDVSNDRPSTIVEIEKQMTGRLYRPPQSREVRLHRFLMRDTIEEAVYERTLRHIDLRSVWNTPPAD